MSEVASPCNKVCTMDPGTGFCIGCMRTMEEIAAWPTLDEGERQRIVEALAARRGARAVVRCSRCGVAFGCGAGDRERPCWCAGYPPVSPSAGGGCLCPNCLRNAGTTAFI